jgi:hypothetical protein
LLRYQKRGSSLEPRYLDGSHAGLVRALLEVYQALGGARRVELAAKIGEQRVLAGLDVRLLAGLRRVIEEDLAFVIDAPRSPRAVRAAAFSIAAREEGDRGRVLAETARRLELPASASPGEIESWLYADLQSERRLRLAAPLPQPQEVIGRYNFRLMQGFFLQAARVRIEVDAGVRPIYRLARLHGLLFEALETREGAARFEITGPLSLLKQTRKYGSALARFLPACCVAPRFHIEAELLLDHGAWQLEVSDADRLLSSHRLPRDFDSRSEKRFYQDFVRLDSDWEILREARLVRRGKTCFFPDFTFRWRRGREIEVDLEIVGFWTSDYLERKFALLRGAAPRPLIVCVDDRLACDAGGPALKAIRFKGRASASRVLEELERIRSHGARSD